jgi:hypothetical protein
MEMSRKICWMKCIIIHNGHDKAIQEMAFVNYD